MNLCIIPARKGSKRIPGKNKRDFFGKPVWHYSAWAAKKSELFHRIILSTNDFNFHYPESVEVAGVELYERTEKNATDAATLYQAVTEVLFGLETVENDIVTSAPYREYEYLCVLYPCAPFVTAGRLGEGYSMMLANNFDAVFPIQRTPGHIEQALRFKRYDKTGKIEPIFPEYKDLNSTPQWIETYKHASQWFWVNMERFMKRGTFIPENSGGLVLPWYEAHDIDTLEDWQIAEWKFKYFQQQVGNVFNG